MSCVYSIGSAAGARINFQYEITLVRYLEVGKRWRRRTVLYRTKCSYRAGLSALLSFCCVLANEKTVLLIYHTLYYSVVVFILFCYFIIDIW